MVTAAQDQPALISRPAVPLQKAAEGGGRSGRRRKAGMESFASHVKRNELRTIAELGRSQFDPWSHVHCRVVSRGIGLTDLAFSCVAVILTSLRRLLQRHVIPPHGAGISG